MGFMDISIAGSDTANDLASVCADKILVELKKEIKTDNSNFNTPGYVNAGLVIRDMHLCLFSSEIREFTKKSIIPNLKKHDGKFYKCSGKLDIICCRQYKKLVADLIKDIQDFE